MKYEDLIVNTENTMRSISEFINVNYIREFLNHSNYIGSKVILERNGWSSSQVNKSIYADSLKPWIGKNIYNSNTEILKKSIDMLSKFGYEI